MKVPAKLTQLSPVLLFLVFGALLNSYFTANTKDTSPLMNVTMLSDQDGPVDAPDFELKDLTGQRIRLSDLRGKLVMLNFWATW